MKWLFSLQGLIAVASGIAVLCGVYLFFGLLSYAQPVWSIVKTVSVPLLLALILAYLMNPLVQTLKIKCRLPRTYAILLLFLFLFGGLALLGWRGVPVFVAQVKELMQQLPLIEAQLSEWYQMLDGQVEQLPTGAHEAVDDVIQNFEQNIRQTMEQMMLSVVEWIGSFLFLLVVPFLVFYLLQEVEMIGRLVYLFLPRKHYKPFLRLWKDIDHSLGQYIRGQLTVSLLVGVLACIGYYIIGLPYALSLALFVAVTNIIPYFGPFIGATPAVLIALITDPQLVLWVLVVNTTIQVLEGNLIAPYIVGRKLRMHPIFIILALLVGAETGGLIGLILAVPVFVVLKVIIVNTVLHFRRYQSRQPRIFEEHH